MNGKISVDSELDKGSKFTVEIPVVSPKIENTSPKTKHISEANLLIVEDVPTNQAFLSRLLSLKNSNIYIASDHKECFEIMRHAAELRGEAVGPELFLSLSFIRQWTVAG